MINAQTSLFDPIEYLGKKPTILESGAIKGCNIIYAPRGQAAEYAKLAANPYRGCGHKCVYCYVPSALRMSRDDFDNNVQFRLNFIPKLEKDAVKYAAAGIKNQILLSFTTDPYNPYDDKWMLTRQTIRVLRKYDLPFCTLTKGGSRALRDIDLFRPGTDSFASTLTSLDDSISLEWEPNAAPPGDRIDTLKKFNERGVYTWVSLEPVFDTEATLQIIKETYIFVGLYKVGKINYHPSSKTIDWQLFTDRVINLLDRLGCNYYIKKSLQPYLKSVEADNVRA